MAAPPAGFRGVDGERPVVVDVDHVDYIFRYIFMRIDEINNVLRVGYGQIVAEKRCTVFFFQFVVVVADYIGRFDLFQNQTAVLFGGHSTWVGRLKLKTQRRWKLE